MSSRRAAPDDGPDSDPTDVDQIFLALGDPVRRAILELLEEAGERTAGAIAEVLADGYRISQPATSQHLRVLRESGLVSVRADGRRRMYAVDPAGLATAGEWIARFADPFAQPLDALETELVRGQRDRRRAEAADLPTQPNEPTSDTA